MSKIITLERKSSNRVIEYVIQHKIFVQITQKIHFPYIWAQNTMFLTFRPKYRPETGDIDLGHNKLQRYCCPIYQKHFKIQNIKIHSNETEISIVEKWQFFKTQNLSPWKIGNLKIFLKRIFKHACPVQHLGYHYHHAKINQDLKSLNFSK